MTLWGLFQDLKAGWFNIQKNQFNLYYINRIKAKNHIT